MYKNIECCEKMLLSQIYFDGDTKTSVGLRVNTLRTGDADLRF